MMGKRIFLFLLTNILIMVTITVILGILGIFFPGIGQYTHGNTLNLTGLFVFCLVWGMGGAFISLQMSRWMAKTSMGVRLVDGATGNAKFDWLYATVKRLSLEAGIPMPEVGYYDSPEINAFATGPSKSRSLVAVSSGLLQTMNASEAEGVIGHEIAHISNGDMVTMTLIQGVLNAFVMFFARIVGWAVGQALSNRDEEGRGHNAFSMMAQFGVTIAAEIAFGILASFVTAWFSRQREYRADEGGARLAGRDKMIMALEKLAGYQKAIDPRGAELATMKISGKSWLSLLSTHPPLEDRIATLRKGG
ncbi:MAG: protease HtpX [Fibrobacteria bacterium]|nr:protease HtpX [Fibrobacteria bacterium]